MTEYPPKILIAFAETFTPNDEIFNWLMKNGYPELGALSACLKGSKDAFNWLMKNGYPHFCALDSAIDGNRVAHMWLQKNKFDMYAVLADVCRNVESAIAYCKENQLTDFLYIGEKFRRFHNLRKYDYHKLNF